MALPEADHIWMDGTLKPWRDATVHVLSGGLHYGTGVLEGTRAHATPRGPAVFRLADHVRRLFDSARIVRLRIPFSGAELCDATVELVRANGLPECYIRHLVTVGYGEMGPQLNETLPLSVSIAAWEWSAYLADGGAGIRLATSSWRRNDANALPPAAKTTGGYLNSALAKSAALADGYDDALLLSPDGFVSECSAMNVFAVRDGELLTPPPSAGALRGLTQDTVLTLARDMGVPVRVTDLVRTDLYTADEVFVSGTAAGIVPVREIDGRGPGEPGPLTRKLADAYDAAVTGADERYAHWLTYVD